MKACDWTGSAGTSNKAKAYCPDCSERCRYLQESEKAMKELCLDCRPVAARMRAARAFRNAPDQEGSTRQFQ